MKKCLVLYTQSPKSHNLSYTISLISKMMHGGKVKGTDFVLFHPTMHQIYALDLPTMHNFGFWRLAIWYMASSSSMSRVIEWCISYVRHIHVIDAVFAQAH